MSSKVPQAGMSPELLKLSQDIAAYRRENPPITMESALNYRPDPSSYIAGTLGFFKRKSTALFMGPTSQGKTVLAMQMGMQAACGVPLMGIIPVQGPVKVLMMECESGMEVACRNMKAIQKNLGLDKRLLQKNFRLVDNHKYRDLEVFYFLQAELNDFAAGWVILDNLQGLMEGNINDNQTFNEFINPITTLIKERDAGLLLLDHTVKPSKDGTGLSDHDGAYRAAGTSRKANWARTTFDLAYISNDGRHKICLSKSGAWAGLKDEGGKTKTHFFVQQSGNAEEPFWALAESQAAPMKGSKPKVDLAELEKVMADNPDFTQQDLADYFGVTRETINRTFGKKRLVLGKRKK